MKQHITIDDSGNDSEIIARAFIRWNPNVHSEELQARLVKNKSGTEKVDIRIWIDSTLSGNSGYKGSIIRGLLVAEFIFGDLM